MKACLYPVGVDKTTYFHMLRLFNIAKWLPVAHFSPSRNHITE